MRLLYDQTTASNTGWLFVGNYYNIITTLIPSGTAKVSHSLTGTDADAVDWPNGVVAVATHELLMTGQYLKATAVSGTCRVQVAASEPSEC